ncbi:TetR/AcrR family transcriptional regulator [Mycolicibacterium sp.]|uniref:TetR/AcrR family transcriptional regulator n=1 Tax=Mycolicibacterium sp. TaxID=2320850 RepID=UPI001A29C4CC|nr:TetR/AcrR family transcriptional regulator [Mycolicibacterium sp.]MBJ7339332.1 TetR/AcrR family transcriptional regulator [Mycolicibacterium sp.]
MTQTSKPASALRVVKKERTRTALVNAAVDLCLRRGYDNTTIDDIARAADVSPRTLARYFTTKDAVFVAVLDDLAEAVAAELTALPPEIGPLQAMRTALGTILTRAGRSQFSSGERIVRTIRVVTECAALQRAAVEYRGPQVLAAMAHRMNVDIDDRRLELAMTLISVTVVHAWSTLDTSAAPLNPQRIKEQIDRTFDEFASFAADLEPAAG